MITMPYWQLTRKNYANLSGREFQTGSFGKGAEIIRGSFFTGWMNAIDRACK